MALIASVSGVRGIIGEDLTPAVATEFGSAFATWLGGGRIIVGGDTRPSGRMLRQAVEAGLLACGCDVIDLGTVTTPGAALSVKQLGAAGGVVITASHNPAEYNGIKFLTGKGWAPPADEARKIYAIRDQRAFSFRDALHCGRLDRDGLTHQRHLDAVLAVIDAETIRARRFKVVLDSINGAGSLVTPILLAKLDCEARIINGEPTGLFAHPPEPTAENLRDLVEEVRRTGAAVGFAQDPDADRLAIVDETGRYIGEEYTLALAAWQVLKSHPGPVAANLSTSRLIDAVAQRFGVEVIRTPVGEANVAAAMLQADCVFGGEGNGGVIDPRVVAVRDSLVGIGHVLQLMAEENRPLSDLVDSLPRYAMIKRKAPLQRERLQEVYNSLKQTFAAAKCNTADGLRIDLSEGWLHVRPSNTEPIVRIIVEAADQDAAKRLADQACRILQETAPTAG